jgi:DTW domain-containing protein YfiP
MTIHTARTVVVVSALLVAPFPPVAVRQTSIQLLSRFQNDEEEEEENVIPKVPLLEPQLEISRSQQLKQQGSFLSNIISSPERYARALNMNVEQVARTKQAHLDASQQLHKCLSSSSSSLSPSTTTSTSSTTTTTTTTTGNTTPKSSSSNNNASMTGRDKHHLICQHRFQHGRHPFVCRNCWCYQPVCICNHPLLVRRQEGESHMAPPAIPTKTTSQSQQSLPSPLLVQQRQRRSMPFASLQVVIWMHHKEWGLTSNTGSILPLMLDQCSIWMKGLPEHDAQLEACLKDDSCLVVVLWPSTKQKKKKKNNNNNNNKVLGGGSSSTSSDTFGEDEDEDDDNDDGGGASSSSSSISISPDDLLQQLKHAESQQQQQPLKPKRIVVLAIDGTWRNARRMVGRLPSTVPRMDLSMDALCHPSMRSITGEGSILAPLRTKGTNHIRSSSGITYRHETDNNDDDTTNDTNDDDTTTKSTEDPHHVCTAQAVVCALAQLGLPAPDVEDILTLTKIKVDLIRRYRGKRL